MNPRLQGKTAFITGATSSIGRAIAERFASEGALVGVGARDSERGTAVVKEIIAAGGHAVFVHADLDGTAENSADIARRAEEALGGRVDVLVNNAAAVPVASTQDTNETQMATVLAVNLTGPFFLVAQLAPRMASRGGGVVITISSWMAQGGTAGVPAYSATKGAMDALTRDWAVEFGSAGVRFNAISPGVVREADDHSDPAWSAVVGTPLGHAVRPSDIAAGAAFLASDEAAAIHGIRLDVDGGRTSTAIIAG